MHFFVKILFLAIFLKSINLLGQNTISSDSFKNFSAVTRYDYLNTIPFYKMDSANIMVTYSYLLGIVDFVNDPVSKFYILFSYFQERNKLKLSNKEILFLLKRMVEFARKNKLEVELAVANHYSFFEDYTQNRTSHQQTYFEIIKEFENFERIGFENFKRYRIDRMLWHISAFMFISEDFERAGTYLRVAEKVAVKKIGMHEVYILVLNHIQSLNQKKGNFEKAKEYSLKIINFCKTNYSDDTTYAKYWLGLSQIDLASILVRQNKLTDGEKYADSGYLFAKANNWSDIVALNTEFDALMVLIDTKLILGKLKESMHLLDRAKSLLCFTDYQPERYFKSLLLFELISRYSEANLDYKTAYEFSKKAKLLRDSLESRNNLNANKSIERKWIVDNYNEKLQNAQREKELQLKIRNISFFCVILIAINAYFYLMKLKIKKREALNALESAKMQLTIFTKGLKDKNEHIDELRDKIKQLSSNGQRLEHLEKVVNSTILTEEDWTKFKLLFERVYPDYLVQLKMQYPFITSAETRLLALEKLNISTIEMAKILGVTKNSIIQTRLRFRRKAEKNGDLISE